MATWDELRRLAETHDEDGVMLGFEHAAYLLATAGLPEIDRDRPHAEWKAESERRRQLGRDLLASFPTEMDAYVEKVKQAHRDTPPQRVFSEEDVERRFGGLWWHEGD